MKQIIILEINPGTGGEFTVRALFWVPVPSGQEVEKPNISNSAYSKATADEIAMLQKGVIIEEVKMFPFPDSTTPESIQTYLLAHYESRVAFLNTIPFSGKLYGMFYDGNGWNGK